MIDITDYMKRSKVERQSHLQLNEPCIERGCNSQACRGLLAHVLDTTVPKGLKVVLCHACHNSKCNSPKHLYWGTAAENVADTMANGGLTFEEKIKAKHGTEGFKKIMTANANKRWQKNYATVAQLAEATDSNPVQCRFESDRWYQDMPLWRNWQTR